MLARVGQAWGLFWSSVSTTMSASRKPSRVVSRYFMQCASLMQPFSSFWLPLHAANPPGQHTANSGGNSEGKQERAEVQSWEKPG